MRNDGKWRRGKGSEASRILLDDPQGGPSKTVAELWYGGWTPAEIHEHAAFIVRACNAYGPLVTACEAAVKALKELPRKHWPKGLDGRRFWPHFDTVAELNAAITLATEAADG